MWKYVSSANMSKISTKQKQNKTHWLLNYAEITQSLWRDPFLPFPSLPVVFSHDWCPVVGNKGEDYIFLEMEGLDWRVGLLRKAVFFTWKSLWVLEKALIKIMTRFIYTYLLFFLQIHFPFLLKKKKKKRKVVVIAVFLSKLDHRPLFCWI